MFIKVILLTTIVCLVDHSVHGQGIGLTAFQPNPMAASAAQVLAQARAQVQAAAQAQAQAAAQAAQQQQAALFGGSLLSPGGFLFNILRALAAPFGGFDFDNDYGYDFDYDYDNNLFDNLGDFNLFENLGDFNLFDRFDKRRR